MTVSWKQLLVQILLLLASCRNINTKTAAPTPAPLVPITPLQTNKEKLVLTDESHIEKVVELTKPVNLTLECTWTGSRNKLPNITGLWRKDGHEIPESRVAVELEEDRYNLKRVFSITSQENLGNYSCVFENEARIVFILTVPRFSEVRDKPVVSYVRDFVVIPCKLDDSKPQPDTWIWYKFNGTEKEQIIVPSASQHYAISIDGKKSKLKVKNVSEADSGVYYCGAVYTVGTSMSRVELKVITFMEPLKPFLSILVEVLILVTVILLYERSQAKKNKAEENRTNADQKNMEWQGEDKGAEEGSSVRQRKA